MAHDIPLLTFWAQIWQPEIWDSRPVLISIFPTGGQYNEENSPKFYSFSNQETEMQDRQ